MISNSKVIYKNEAFMISIYFVYELLTKKIKR